VIEGDAVSVYLYEKMIANSTITNFVGQNPQSQVWQIYEAMAPQQSTYPHAIIIPPASTFYRTRSQGKRIFRIARYVVKFVTQGDSFAPSRDPVDAVDSIFSRDQVNDNDAIVAGCHTVSDFKYVTVEDGVRYNHHGVILEVWAYGVN